MNNIYILYYIFMALPIPVSMITWVGTIISVANIGAISGSIVHNVVALSAMLLAGTYLITYLFSIYRTKKVGKITFAFFLPILHIVTTFALIEFWTWFDKGLITCS